MIERAIQFHKWPIELARARAYLPTHHKALKNALGTRGIIFSPEGNRTTTTTTTTMVVAPTSPREKWMGPLWHIRPRVVGYSPAAPLRVPGFLRIIGVIDNSRAGRYNGPP